MIGRVLYWGFSRLFGAHLVSQETLDGLDAFLVEEFERVMGR